MVRRVGIGIASAALLVAMAYPAVAPGELDSLPLSNYPMFAHDRSPVTRFSVAVWLDETGEERRLDLRLVGGTDQPVQAAMTVRQAIRAQQSDILCREIAEQLDEPGTVQVAVVTYDAPGWFAGRKDPIERDVHAECPSGVER